MTNIDKLKEKLTAQRLRDEAQGVLDIKNNKQVQKDFSDEMVSKTWKYLLYRSGFSPTYMFYNFLSG